MGEHENDFVNWYVFLYAVALSKLAFSFYIYWISWFLINKIKSFDFTDGIHPDDFFFLFLQIVCCLLSIKYCVATHTTPFLHELINMCFPILFT